MNTKIISTWVNGAFFMSPQFLHSVPRIHFSFGIELECDSLQTRQKYSSSELHAMVSGRFFIDFYSLLKRSLLFELKFFMTCLTLLSFFISPSIANLFLMGMCWIVYPSVYVFIHHLYFYVAQLSETDECQRIAKCWFTKYMLQEFRFGGYRRQLLLGVFMKSNMGHPLEQWMLLMAVAQLHEWFILLVLVVTDLERKATGISRTWKICNIRKRNSSTVNMFLLVGQTPEARNPDWIFLSVAAYSDNFR